MCKFTSVSLASSLWWSSPPCTPSSYTHPWKTRNACKYTISLIKSHRRWCNNLLATYDKTSHSKYIDFLFTLNTTFAPIIAMIHWAETLFVGDSLQLFWGSQKLTVDRKTWEEGKAHRSYFPLSKSCFRHNILRHVWHYGFLVVLQQQLKCELIPFTSSETQVFSIQCSNCT